MTDGTSNTIYVGETLVEAGDLGWMSGTRATLRNMGSPIDHPIGGTTMLAMTAKPVKGKAAAPSDLKVGGFGAAIRRCAISSSATAPSVRLATTRP